MSVPVACGPDAPSAPAADGLLVAHLRAYLGAWPPATDVGVVGWPARLEPGWDGTRAPAVVLTSPEGTVISVPPETTEAVAPLVDRLAAESFPEELTKAVAPAAGALVDGRGSGHDAGPTPAIARPSPWLVLRWSTEPAPLPPLGRWMDADDPSLPEWLRAFANPVLATFDGDGRYLAGVGIKPHTRWGRELAVGTDEAARGRGLARRLVAEAGRAVLADGAVPLYVHHPDNVASARVADAAGFPDLGWRLLVVFAP